MVEASGLEIWRERRRMEGREGKVWGECLEPEKGGGGAGAGLWFAKR